MKVTNTEAKVGELWLTKVGTFAKITEAKEGELYKATLYKNSDSPDNLDWPLSVNSNCTDDFLVNKITSEEYPEYFL